MKEKVKQSFENLQRAIRSLELSLATPPTEERDYAGIIQSFEFTYELTWQTLKAILEDNGISAPFPRVAFEEAYKRDMIHGNEIWKDIMEARNKTVHTYDSKLAVAMVKEIQGRFLIVFQKSFKKIETFVK